MVAKHGGMCLKWVCPGWTGVPDRIILLPDGKVIFCELKRPKGGRLSPMQKWWAKKLIDMGFQYDQVWDWEDLNQLHDMIQEEATRREQRVNQRPRKKEVVPCSSSPTPINRPE